MNRKIIAALLIVVGIGLAVYGFISLPDTVVVQIDFEGNPSNTMPKPLAIIIPLLLDIAGAGLVAFGKSKNTKKYIVLSIAGIAVMIVTLIGNLISFQLPM